MLKAKLMVIFGGLFISASCLSANDVTPEDQKTVKPVTEESAPLACEEAPCGSKGFDGRLLLENEPTKQVLKSLESLGETLNSLSILMFAGDKA
ncbi:hypothetical protein ACPV4A_13085 [Vibrio rotiferianus]|uniref:hypothetical protein n=1 Tax=Vibrio rotiferianus TaxID=190895 RepID=UPI00406A55B7